MSACAFCNVTNTARNKVLKTYPSALVVMANQRKVRGQVLVIPKRHMERLSELTKAEREEIFEIIADAEKRIIDHYKSGCDMWQNYKPYMAEDGFKVSHLHFHVVPRHKDDELYAIRDAERVLYQFITDDEVAELAEVFKD